ncbi:MAG: PASTA domain-containing protein [Pseudomonadota bacterium]
MGIPPIRGTFDLGNITDPRAREQVQALQTEREQLTQRVQQLEGDSAALQSARAEANAAKAEANTAKSEIQRLGRTSAELKAQADQASGQLTARTAELQQARQEISARDTELSTLRASDAVGKQAVANQAVLTGKIADLTAQVKARDVQLADVPRLNSKVAELAEQVKTRDAQITELNKRIAAPPAGGGGAPGRAPAAAISITTLASNVGMQVSDAQQVLKTSNFALANVSVRLKAMAEGDGSQVRILNVEDIKSAEIANSLDEFHLDFTAKPSAGSEAGKVDVPDLSGLTRGAVQRMLAALGLRLDAAAGKAPASAKAATGQAFKQSPEAGAKADRGLSVLVVFAQ